jgi:hypothetical protein
MTSLEFGSNVQTHEQHYNSMAPLTVGPLVLHPIGNAQGGTFFSLLTGKVLNLSHVTLEHIVIKFEF